MKNINIKPLKVAASLLVIATLFACLDVLTINVLFKNEIDMAVSTLNPMTNENEVVESNAIMKVIGDGSKLIQNYPEYGQAYGSIAIPSVGIDLPIYSGDSADILKNGIGHMVKSYLPGEGSSIILGGLNTNIKLGKLKDVKSDDMIEVKTSYGKFTYKVYDFKVLTGAIENLLPIQRNQEILMIYTNYPFGNLGYTTKKYVVYASLLNYEIYEVKK